MMGLIFEIKLSNAITRHVARVAPSPPGPLLPLAGEGEIDPLACARHRIRIRNRIRRLTHDGRSCVALRARTDAAHQRNSNPES